MIRSRPARRSVHSENFGMNWRTVIPNGPDLPELSMGMSGDFEVAIEEGATLVRIGSALFDGLDSSSAGSDCKWGRTGGIRPQTSTVPAEGRRNRERPARNSPRRLGP